MYILRQIPKLQNDLQFFVERLIVTDYSWLKMKLSFKKGNTNLNEINIVVRLASTLMVNEVVLGL